MTLYRELEVGEAAISNRNGFKQGTVFDHEGDIVDEMRSGEAITVFTKKAKPVQKSAKL